MSPLGCFLILAVTVINVQKARAACFTPSNFLPYDVGEGELPSDALFDQLFNFGLITGMFGEPVSMAIRFQLSGALHIGSRFKLQPGPLDINAHQPDGKVYVRHTTDQADLDMVHSIVCEPFVDVVVITYYCVVPMGSLTPVSYQVIIAIDVQTKPVVIINYGTSTGITSRFFAHRVTMESYPLDEADIADDGITITDVFSDPAGLGGMSLPVEAGAPCPGAAKTCSVYADGRVTTLDGNTLADELTLEQSYVATVDKAEKKKNNDPCKFFLMIRTTEAFVPVYYVRIGVGVHPNNNRKYLRKFQFSLTDDSFVKEFGYSFSADNLLHQTDMPYTMDDTGSAVSLGITVEVTDANDGWIIKSATCGYSFTHLWNNQDPIVTMTLDGDRYDGRIQETCGGM